MHLQFLYYHKFDVIIHYEKSSVIAYFKSILIKKYLLPGYIFCMTWVDTLNNAVLDFGHN